MPCYRPIQGHRSAKLNENGKSIITFSAHDAYKDLPVTIPCGHCIGCKTERTNEWAARCYHEAKMHKANSFLTLTYDDEHVPPGGTLVKEHLQNFMKRFRTEIWPEQIRFFGCGEYGEKLSRPHYHLLVFGHDFPDKLLHTRNKKSGQYLYRSATLEKLWPSGFSTIGLFDLASAKYVAAYTAKKITGSAAEAHYKGKLPEFALMSRNPGIGRAWLEKYESDVYPKDFFTIKGVKYRPPRYYDKCLEKKNPKRFMRTKRKRIALAKLDTTTYVRRSDIADAKSVMKKQIERRRFEQCTK